MPVLLGLIASLFASVFIARSEQPPYSPDPGPYQVVVVERFELHDDARDKALELTVRHPRGDGPFPMVVFSHGAGGSCDGFPDLSAYLASHGYVVVHPTHSDSIRHRRAQGDLKPGRFDISEVISKVDIRDRSADVRFILDSTDALESHLNTPDLIDEQRLAMAGHSAGAMTTQAMGGVRFFPRGRGRGIALPERRFDAFVLISGQGTPTKSLNEKSWDDVDSPWLVFGGSEDVSRAADDTAESRRHPYEYAPADDTKYLVYIDGATHSSYQGSQNLRLLGETPPTNIDWIVEITNMGTLAFLDAYVKGDADAKEWLDAGGLMKHEGGDVEFLHK